MKRSLRRRAKQAIAAVTPPRAITPVELAELYQASHLSRIDLSRHNAGGVIPTFPNVRSQAASAAQCNSPDFLALARRLQNWDGPPNDRQYQRKLWEWVYILQAITEAGLMRPGASAVGFGVGSEPLPAYFAAEGMTVVATDQGIGGDTATDWTVNNELLQGLHSLSRPHLIADADLAKSVRLRDVDMNAIPADIGTFDIAWSSCVIEHLGSPKHGMDFVIESCKLLNPGGIAVHTTELELTHQTETRDYGHCAVYRIDDLLELGDRLAEVGCSAEFNFTVSMDTFEDRWVSVVAHPDHKPHLPDPRDNVHLKLVLADSVSTSFGILIRKH